MKRRIVAEITRNWTDGKPDPKEKLLISQAFENAITINATRGFTLESWKFSQFVVGLSLTETIIAVFVEA